MAEQYNATAENVTSIITKIVEQDKEEITMEMKRRGFLASNELMTAVVFVLRGQRTGRRYRVPGTYRRQLDHGTGKMRNGVFYTASAPGEAPANRTGLFRASWVRRNYSSRGGYGMSLEVTAAIESDVKTHSGHLLGEVLENGNRRGMAPRPYKQAVKARALPRILEIYRRPY